MKKEIIAICILLSSTLSFSQETKPKELQSSLDIVNLLGIWRCTNCVNGVSNFNTYVNSESIVFLKGGRMKINFGRTEDISVVKGTWILRKENQVSLSTPVDGVVTLDINVDYTNSTAKFSYQGRNYEKKIELAGFIDSQPTN